MDDKGKPLLKGIDWGSLVHTVMDSRTHIQILNSIPSSKHESSLRTPRVDQAIRSTSNPPLTYEGVPYKDLSDEKKVEAESFLKHAQFATAYGATVEDLTKSLKGVAKSSKEISSTFRLLQSQFSDEFVKRALETKEKLVREELLGSFLKPHRPVLVLASTRRSGQTLIKGRKHTPIYGKIQDLVVTDSRDLIGHKLHEYDFFFSYDWIEDTKGYRILEEIFNRHYGRQDFDGSEIWRSDEGIPEDFKPSFVFSNIMVLNYPSRDYRKVVQRLTSQGKYEYTLERATIYQESQVVPSGMTVYYVKGKRTLPQESLPEDEIDLGGELDG